MPRVVDDGLPATLLAASVLAADLVAVVDRDKADVHGFMLRDVRFMFLLFRNWLEHDVRDPEHDIDLTQIRRAIDALVARRRIAIIASARRRGGRRPRTRYALTLAGVLALADQLVAWSPSRSFEEGLFVILFCTAYRALVLRRAEQAGAPVARSRLGRALDPRAVVASIRRALATQRADLEERIAGGDALLAASLAGRRTGASDVEIVATLEQLSTYQLHHIRPLGEVLLALPPALREFEITDGIAARRDLVFAPLLAHTIAQQQILARIEARVG